MKTWGTMIVTVLGALLAGFQPQVQSVIAEHKEIAALVASVLAVVLSQLSPLMQKKDGE